MLRTLVTWLYAIMVFPTLALAASPSTPVANSDSANTADMRLLRTPDIHGDTVVFEYGGDLWTVSAQGGEARRLTTAIGFESMPKFSPDGRWIAFSGEYDGNNDVYVMPAAGGEPARLTFHPGWDRVIGWQPDGEAIRFQSARQSRTGRDLQLYTVARTGGLPERLPLPTGGLSSYAPGGQRIAYNRISRENRTWKRYKGGMAQDVWIYDFAHETSQRVTDWVGTDNFPMWHGDTIYFTSDREPNAKLNIWAYDTRTEQFHQVTHHDEYDVKYPSLGPDAIVYENGGWLYVLDLATEQTRKLTISLHSDNVWARPRLESVADMIRGTGIAPDGQRAVFAARGDVFTVPAEKGPVRNLTSTPAVNERHPVWSPDGRQVAYVGDASGEYEVYLVPADGKGEPRQLTHGLTSWVNSLRWSPDSKWLLLSNAALELLLVDADSGNVTRIDQSPSDDIQEFAWSPAGDWVAYARAEDNGFRSIFLYDLAGRNVHRVTNDFTDDSAPCFDREAKYLFFTSARHFNPTLGGYDLKPLWVNQDGLYLVTLAVDTPRPFPPESDEVAIAADEKSDKKSKSDKKGKASKKDDDDDDDAAPEPLRVDLDGITDRIVALDVEPGNYSGLANGDAGLFFLSHPFTAGGGRDGHGSDTTLEVYDLKEREQKTVLATVDDYDLSADGKKLLYTKDGKFGIVDAKADQKPAEEPLRTAEMKATVDPRAEWREMMRDAWRLERDFFYDPQMHQVDWPHMYDRYAQLVPYVAHGADFSYIVGEMISELSCSHSYVRPGDQPHPDQVGTGLLGCDFALDAKRSRYRFARVLNEHDWNGGPDTPLAGPGIAVQEGDYLLAVDGVALQAPTNPYSLFVDKAGRQVTLRVGPHADGKDSREVVVEPIRDEHDLRYQAWVDANRRKVDELSGGRIGYLHLPNTAIGGQQGFAEGYYPQLRKDGLIIDERFNAGGFIPDFFMNVLRQRLVNLWRRRHGQDMRTPQTAFLGHLAMMSNGYAGSGGDALPYYFKAYDLGPVIGTRTWGGLVGISRGIALMDGGNVTFPEFGLYNLEGQLDVENHGVDPTVVIDNAPEAENAGHDPQLEKTVEVLLKEIADDPVRLPEFRGFPDRRH